MEDYSKYEKKDLVKFFTYLDRPRETLDSLVILICETLSCENCPIVIHNCDHRSQEDKENQDPCQAQLWNWMKKEFENVK